MVIFIDDDLRISIFERTSGACGKRARAYDDVRRRRGRRVQIESDHKSIGWSFGGPKGVDLGSSVQMGTLGVGAVVRIGLDRELFHFFDLRRFRGAQGEGGARTGH